MFGRYKLSIKSIRVAELWIKIVRKAIADRGEADESSEEEEDETPEVNVDKDGKNALVSTIGDQPQGLIRKPQQVVQLQAAAQVQAKMKRDVEVYEDHFGKVEEEPEAEAEASEHEDEDEKHESGGGREHHKGPKGKFDAFADKGLKKQEEGAGKQKKKKFENHYFVPDPIRRLLRKWLDVGKRQERDDIEAAKKQALLDALKAKEDEDNALDDQDDY